MHRKQSGVSGLMVTFVLLLIVIALLVARLLTRLGDSAKDRNDTIASLERVQTALDQFAAAAGANARLPCPADPSLDTGVESVRSASDCNFPTGTLPWMTIGLRRDDAYDAWGRKISYRVYLGNKGSLVRQKGPSMVDCYDDGTNGPGKGTDANGLCKTDHTTSKADYLATGGLSLTEMSNPTRNDVAYVVMSHGPTGSGGYTVSGDQLDTHAGKDEKDNMKDTGPFHIDPWSDPDTAVNNNNHFDDLVAYRTIADLATKAGLAPRPWPAPIVGNATFTNAGALATQLAGGPTSFDFGAITATGLTFGIVPAALAVDTTGTGAGLGMGGGADSQISSSAFESVRFSLDDTSASATMFGITLNNFGTYIATISGISYTYTERVRFTFSNNGSTVATITSTACTTDQPLVTYSLRPNTTFDAVRVTPLGAVRSPSGSSGDTSFAVAGVAFCGTGGTCQSGVSGGSPCAP
jgi:hypothetical protein